MSFRLCAFGHLMSDDELGSLCPECLMAHAPATLTPFGRFERLRILGEGGFGTVYEARAGAHAEPVALKIIRNGSFATAQERVGFRHEIRVRLEFLAELCDDRIVRIHEAGEHEGVPYFTMEYMSGGSLRHHLARFRADPRRAAELVIELAEAVDFLHRDPENPDRPAILHRDLKPGNILFDAGGRPKISDFGIAKVLGDQAGSSTTFHAGCPWYVAPEQAFRSSRALTPAADVYSLGAILYELFTGRVPFDGTEPEVMQQLGDELVVPRAPRELVPGLDRYLETVVLNALEKNPARRYQSARAFAADLRRALKGKPDEELPAVPLRARLRSLLRRRAALAIATLWALAFASYGVVHASQTRDTERVAVTRQLRDDAAMATVQAVAFQFQLREYRHRVARLARQPEIVALLEAGTVENPSQTLIDRASGFDSLFVLAPDGRMRARTTQRSEEYISRSFAFRDYFREARALALTECSPEGTTTPSLEPRPAYLGRVHRSESQGEFEIAISAPVCDERGWIGVLGATISSNKSFGSVRLEDGPAGHVTALLGPRGADRGRPAPDTFTFLVHPNLSPGKEYQLRYPEPRAIRAALGIPTSNGGLRYVEPLLVRDYHDPVAPESGLSTAALAPVDESGFIVLVASPLGAARSRWTSVRDEDLFVLASFSVGFALLLGAHLRSRRSSRRAHLERAWLESS